MDNKNAFAVNGVILMKKTEKNSENKRKLTLPAWKLVQMVFGSESNNDKIKREK